MNNQTSSRWKIKRFPNYLKKMKNKMKKMKTKAVMKTQMCSTSRQNLLYVAT